MSSSTYPFKKREKWTIEVSKSNKWRKEKTEKLSYNIVLYSLIVLQMAFAMHMFHKLYSLGLAQHKTEIFTI